MNYPDQISGAISQLKRVGYSDIEVKFVVASYAGSTLPWQEMTPNQQRRLSDDLRRHVRIARKWHYLTTGILA